MRQLALVILLVAMPGCDKPVQQAPPPPPEVTVTDVVARDVPVYIEAIGETLGSLDISIRARVDGIVEAVHFREGHQVEKDALLYSIDQAPFLATVREAEGKLAEANARLVRAQSNLGRVRPLVEINALSKKTLDDAIAEFDASTGLVKSAEAIVENAKIKLGYSEIHSPIAGLIGVSQAYPGDYVGQYPNPVVLTTVSQLDPIKVRFSISERDYLTLSARHIEKGKRKRDPNETDRLELFLADGTKHPHNGTYTFAGREIDAKTGTLEIEATFRNPDERLRPGQFARIRGMVEMVKSAAMVPQRSVIEIQGTYQVAVVGPDNVVDMRRIEVGTKTVGLQLVKSGVKVGERVVVGGMHRIRSGMKVRPTTQSDDGKAVSR